MTSWHLMAVAACTFAFVAVVGAISRRLAAGPQRRFGLQRKVFHASVYSGAVPVLLNLGFWGLATYGSVVAFMVLVSGFLGGRSPLSGVFSRTVKGRETVGELLGPLLSTATGGLLGILLVGNLATVGFLVCGWGDGVGEPVGKRWGTRHYSPPWGSSTVETRTWEGSAAVFLVGSLGGWVALVTLGYPMGSAVLVGLAAGAAGAAAEGLSSSGTDNFWVQVIPSVVSWWCLS